MEQKSWGKGERPVIGEAVLNDIAHCLSVADPQQITHMGARLQRYSDRYFAARHGHTVRLTPGGLRIFMRSLAGRIERLTADLAKAKDVAAVCERYKDAQPSEPGGAAPSLEELGRQLQYLSTITGDIIETPPHATAKKARPVLHHTIGSFMALFESVSGERARTVATQGSEGGDFLAGQAGLALRKIFEAIDPEVSEATLAGCVNRLVEQFRDREMREGDFDWISAIEDDGSFEVSQIRT